MQSGSQALKTRVDIMRQNLAKYVVSWLGEAIAYWIFTIICIDSVFGFNWWVIDARGRFGIICIVYAVKNLCLLILVPILHKRNKSGGFSEARFPAVDIFYFLTQIIFWVVSTIYAWDRHITPEKKNDPDWVARYQRWTNEAYILPVVKLCVDFLYGITAGIFYPTSHTALSGGGIIWMDLQYLFVYLFITGKVMWDNYFIVFVWIYMGSVVATLFALCILCFVAVSVCKQQGLNVVQYVMYMSIAVMIIIFFVWETIVGSKNYEKDNIYLLLVSVILYTLYNGIQTFALCTNVEIVPPH